MPLVAGQEPKRYRWRLGLWKGRGALPGDLCQGTTCWHSGLEPPGGGGVLAKGSFKGPGPGQVSRWGEELSRAAPPPRDVVRGGCFRSGAAHLAHQAQGAQRQRVPPLQSGAMENVQR